MSVKFLEQSGQPWVLLSGGTSCFFYFHPSMLFLVLPLFVGYIGFALCLASAPAGNGCDDDCNNGKRGSLLCGVIEWGHRGRDAFSAGKCT